MIVKFTSGNTYLGGVDLPFFVPRSMVKSGVEARGFCDVQIAAKDDPGIVQGAVPPVLLDKIDTVGRARFCGSADQSSIDVPSSVIWLYDATAGKFLIGGYPTNGGNPTNPSGGNTNPSGGGEAGGLSHNAMMAIGAAVVLGVGVAVGRASR